MPRIPSPVLFLLVFLCIAFNVHAQTPVSVSATAGSPGPVLYANLKAAFDAVNAGNHQGNITIEIRGNTAEPATAVLNASGSGAASYTNVLINPGAGINPVISGNISSGPVVKLNGSDYVTINGSNNGSTSRNLTITNTSTSASNVVVIGSVGTTPINNVTVKNSILINGTNSSTAVIIGDAAVPGNPGYFKDISIVNNDIRKAYIGLYIYSIIAAGNGNVLVESNDINATGTDAIRLVGIYGQGANGLVIQNNNIGNFDPVSAEFDRGIWLATGTTNAIISGNTISGLSYTGTSSYASIGLNISPNVANANIVIENNTIDHLSSSGTGTTMGIYVYSALSRVTLLNNKISNISNNNTTGYGAAGIMLAPTIAAANIKVRNNFVWDVTGYGFNGYESSNNGNGIVLDGGGGFEIDFNTVSQNANPALTGGHKSSCLLITANVTGAGSVSMRNNIFSNTQTVGNATSKLAISNLATAGAGVFGTIDNNVYYSTSGNLSSTGTNASISNTLAQLQTSLGGNANSLNVQPVFMSSTDLHLSPAANTLIENKAIPLAGISSDIDADLRSATTPDPGADEFILCPVITASINPATVTVCATQNTSFSVTATNATVYQWQVDDGTGFTNIGDNGLYAGTATATLSLTNIPAVIDGYLYRCVVSSGISGCPAVNSNPVTITVKALATVATDPVNAIVSHLDNTSFNASAAGTGPFTYQWQILNGGVFTNLAAGAPYSNVNTATLDITGATVAMSGSQYRLAITGCNVVYSAPATLTVNQLVQTISFASQTNGGTVNVTYGDAAINGAATASSGLAVTYTSGNTGVAEVNTAGQVTIIGAGTTTITASQTGDAVYQAATSISFTVVVNPKVITVTAASISKTYGDADPSLTYSANPALIGTDVFTGALDRDPGENTGSYQILQNTLTAGANYAITFNSGILNIGPKALTVTADDQTRQYGIANPALTLTYSGFAFTDDASSLTTVPVASTAAVPTSWPGDYPITVAGGAASNYTFNFVPGKLTVEAIQLSIDQQPANTMVCTDARATFNTAVTATPAIAPLTYQWQYSTDALNWTDLSQGSAVAYQTRTNAASGYYRCKITVPGADFYTQPAELTLHPLPKIVAAKSNDIDCAYASAQLMAQGGLSYQWTPAVALSNTNIPNPIATPSATTTYLVTGTDVNGCKGTDRITVTYSPSEYNVPNAFTPNNDGKNDCFGVRHWQKVTDFSLSIYNRWGARIFHTTDVSKCWDGTIKDIAQPSGTYIFHIRGMAPCGWIERKGSLILFR